MSRFNSQSWFTRLSASMAILGILQTAVAAQSAPVPPNGWEAAIAATSGAAVRVHLMDGTVVNGVLETATQDVLILTRVKLERGRVLSSALKEPSATFKRAEVAKVEVADRVTGKRRLGYALVAAGAIIGGVVVALVAVCASGRDRCGS